MDPTWFELTLEQKLEIERIRREAPNLPRETLESLAVSAAQLAIQRQNIISNLVQQLAKNGGI